MIKARDRCWEDITFPGSERVESGEKRKLVPQGKYWSKKILQIFSQISFIFQSALVRLGYVIQEMSQTPDFCFASLLLGGEHGLSAMQECTWVFVQGKYNKKGEEVQCEKETDVLGLIH